MVALKALPGDLFEELMRTRWLAALWDEVRSRAGDALAPVNWVDWVKALEDDSFDNSTDFAERAVIEWGVAEQFPDVSVASGFAEAVDGLTSDIALNRFADALPVLWMWFREESHFPQKRLLPVYEQFLLQIEVFGGRSIPELQLVNQVVDAILGAGPNRKLYDQSMTAFANILREANGAHFLDTLLEALELVNMHGSPNQDARQRIWFTVVDLLQSLHRHVDNGQREDSGGSRNRF